MPKIRYRDCPTCRQPMVDLSNNPAFVNPNPENFDANTGTNRSSPSNMGGIPPGNGHSSIPPVDKSTRKIRKRTESVPNVVNLSRKELSKDSKLAKASVYKK